jgi:serine/threonine protein kinase
VDAAEAPLPYSDFVLEEMIGAGTMGKVYRARQRSHARRVAIKFLRKSFLSRPDAVEAFLREARTIAGLQHPHVVGVHGLGRTPRGGLFIVMDLMDGGDLSRQLAGGPVPHERAVAWVVEATGALAHAHARRILHCDLKPANLLLDSAGRVRLTDFGLARRLRHEPLTASNIAGTAAYIAPEQVADCWGPITPATDVYGLGAVLYHLLTGRPPYGDDRAPDVLARVVAAAMPVAPRELVPDVPCRLSDACLRCLAKRGADRFQSVAELRMKVVSRASS